MLCLYVLQRLINNEQFQGPLLLVPRAGAHPFCSFLALVLRDELFRRMDNAGVSAEWDDILRDLNALTETAITYKGKTFVVRSNTVGVAGKIAQCVGVRLPNTVRQIDDEKESADQSL